jgi:hypothetical protein
MYATVRIYAGAPGLIDELVSHEDGVRGVISGISGLHAYYLIRTSDGGAASISVFDDKGGADESNRAAREWIRENLPDLSVGPPQVIEGDVAIHF